MVRLRKSRGTDGRGGCTRPLTGLPPCGEALQRVRTAPLRRPSLPLCADLDLLRLLDRNRAEKRRPRPRLPRRVIRRPPPPKKDYFFLLPGVNGPPGSGAGRTAGSASGASAESTQ